MKHLNRILILVTAALLIACADPKIAVQTVPEVRSNLVESEPAVEASEKPVEAAADSVFGTFTTRFLDGGAADQTVFSDNKLTMVNIWATYCGPCLQEMPHLGEIASEYADRGFGIVGIPVDIADYTGSVYQDLFAEAKEIVEQTGADYPHLVPNRELIENHLIDVLYVPETIFVDSEGRQVGDSVVGARTKEEWKAIIDELLETVK